MWSLRLGLLLALSLTCGGCFQLSSMLTVKGDGSGTIRQHVLFTSAALAHLRGFGALGGGSGQDFDPISEQEARGAAAALGPGVTYVSSTSISTSEGQGRDITYAFADISQLRLTDRPPVPGGASARAPGLLNDQISFTFTRRPSGNALVRIGIPRPSIPTLGTPTRSGSRQPTPDQMTMFKQMLAGARVSLVVEPFGELVRTNSPYVDGRRVTLIDVDFDQLLDTSVISRLQAAQTAEEVKAMVTALRGVKVNLEPEVTIEFTPAQ